MFLDSIFRAKKKQKLTEVWIVLYFQLVNLEETRKSLSPPATLTRVTGLESSCFET